LSSLLAISHHCAVMSGITKGMVHRQINFGCDCFDIGNLW
jgi:hypothetical protein